MIKRLDFYRLNYNSKSDLKKIRDEIFEYYIDARVMKLWAEYYTAKWLIEKMIKKLEAESR